MALGCGCNSLTQLVPRYQLPDGSFVYPTVSAEGVFTIPDPTFQEPWVGVGGDGINIVEGGESGHGPTIELCVDPNSPVALTFVDIGGTQCLTAEITEDPWQTSNVITANGIHVQQSEDGVNTFEIVFGPDEPFAFDEDGRLEFTGDLSGFTCASLAGCSITALADVSLQDSRSEGDVLVFDENGRLVNEPLLEAVGFQLSGGVAALPPAPTSGGPYLLQWDPTIGEFSWQ